MNNCEEKTLKEKLAEIDKQIDANPDLNKRIQDEIVDITEEVTMTDEQKEKLKAMGEGIEIDNMSEDEILEDLVSKFNPREMAKPLVELNESLETQMIEELKAFNENHEFDDVFMKESIYKTWNNIKKKFNISHLEVKHFERITSDPGLYSLIDGYFSSHILSKRNKNQVSPRLSADEQKTFLAIMGYASMKQSTDEYIDTESRHIELYALRSKKLKELAASIDREVLRKDLKDKLIEIITSKEDLDNRAFMKEYSIYGDYSNKIVTLKAMAEICGAFEDENGYLQSEINALKDKFLHQAESLENIINFKFIEPFKVYMDAMRDRDKDTMIKNLTKEYNDFIMRLIKFPYKIPFPGIREEDKTLGDIFTSMKVYMEKLIEANPGLGLDADSLSTALMLITWRYERKHLKHVDFDNDKETLYRFYLIFETYCKFDQDKQFIKDLVEKIKEAVGDMFS